jgi:hypothetical protein
MSGTQYHARMLFNSLNGSPGSFPPDPPNTPISQNSTTSEVASNSEIMMLNELIQRLNFISNNEECRNDPLGTATRLESLLYGDLPVEVGNPGTSKARTKSEHSPDNLHKQRVPTTSSVSSRPSVTTRSDASQPPAPVPAQHPHVETRPLGTTASARSFGARCQWRNNARGLPAGVGHITLDELAELYGLE